MAKGEIRHLVLNKEGRAKLDTSPDSNFYSLPRFITHVDDGFLSTLTHLYGHLIPSHAHVLDLMSSCLTLLPPDLHYPTVVGHGFNASELALNNRLHSFFVKDLNQDPSLDPLQASSFDAVTCAVSVQYLQQPEKVLAEIYRVLRPGGVCIVSFSNRMLYDKAIAAWRDGTPYSRTQLVVQYFQCVVGFTQPQIIKQRPSLQVIVEKRQRSPIDWLLGLLQPETNDPFYAVVAYKGFTPDHTNLDCALNSAFV